MTDSIPGGSGPILDYRGPAEPPAVESWTAASVVGVLASAVVLGRSHTARDRTTRVSPCIGSESAADVGRGVMGSTGQRNVLAYRRPDDVRRDDQEAFWASVADVLVPVAYWGFL